MILPGAHGGTERIIFAYTYRIEIVRATLDVAFTVRTYLRIFLTETSLRLDWQVPTLEPILYREPAW